MHCLGKIVKSSGNCKACMENKDPNKRPNNYDCPFYRPLGALVIEVKEKEATKE